MATEHKQSDSSELVHNDVINTGRQCVVNPSSIRLGQVNAGFAHDESRGRVTPVSYYSAASGGSRSSRATVVTRPDGSKVIITPDRDHRKMPQTPLTEKQVLVFKILSVLACVFFPPTGIPAVYYAWQTKTELDEGLLRGNLDRAYRARKVCERLLIFSLLLGLVMYVLIIALIQRTRLGPDEDHSTIGNHI